MWKSKIRKQGSKYQNNSEFSNLLGTKRDNYKTTKYSLIYKNLNSKIIENANIKCSIYWISD